MGSCHRVLFFVEPYCVRSGVDDFRTPFEIFWQIAALLGAQPSVSSALVCSRGLAARRPPRVRCYCPDDFGIDEAMSSDWEANWTLMLRGENVGDWEAFYRWTVKDFAPTLAYMWNKNSLFQNACWRAGVPVLTFEYGGVRTPSGFRISVDPQGFGPESALATGPLAPRDDVAAPGWRWAATHVYRDALLMHLPRQTLPHAGNKLHVCVLLQKEDDVNNLVWPTYESMWSYLEHVLAQLRDLDRVRTTVRPHPAGLQDYAERVARHFPSVQVDDGQRNFYQVLLDFDCVISLNSAAGFEALLCGLPAMTLARSFYRCAFVGEPGQRTVGEFVRSVRENTFWSASRRLEVGTFIYRLVNHYSIPQEMLRQPSLHLSLLDALSGRSVEEVAEWFELEPPSLADLVRGCETDMIHNELGSLRVENHARAASVNNLDTRAARAERESTTLARESLRHAQTLAEIAQANFRRDEAISHLSDTLAEMTRQNQNRDQAIAQVSETLSEMTEANARRDEAIAHLSETLAEMTKDNTQRDEAITRLSETLSEMTEANARRDESIAHLSETLAEMTRQNRRRDEAIAALAEQSAEHATAIERKTQEVEMGFRQHLEMLQQQIDDVRRRSVRVPSAVYRLWRRLLRRRGPA